MKEDLFVFGYGSLMWNPGFEFEEARLSSVDGFRRRACIYSVHYRGTPENPGLVLGLQEGGACQGMLFRVRAEKIDETLETLWDREMSGGSYLDRTVMAEWEGLKVPSLAFVANKSSPRYAGHLTEDQCANIIAYRRGLRGSTLEYFEKTLEHLRAMKCFDRELGSLVSKAKNLVSHASKTENQLRKNF